MLESPLSYFGNRLTSSEDIILFIKKGMPENKKYKNFYDLFSGSGSIGLAALGADIAENIIISDAYPAFKDFWIALQNQRQDLIQVYQKLASTYEATEQKEIYFQAIQKNFNEKNLNSAEKAAYFAFILNHTENNELKIENSQLICEHTKNTGNAIAHDKKFKELAEKVGQKFDEYKGHITFEAKPFQKYQETPTAEDFIFLDPPYPCTFPPVYYRPPNENMNDLQQDLQKALLLYAKNSVKFICFYELIGKERHSDKSFNGAVRYAHSSYSPLYGSYLENCYVSPEFEKTFSEKKPDDITGKKFVEYSQECEKWEQLSYGDAHKAFEKSLANSKKSQEITYGARLSQFGINYSETAETLTPASQTDPQIQEQKQPALGPSLSKNG